MSRRQTLACLSFLLACVASDGARADTSTARSPPQSSTPDPTSWIVLPNAFYTPETGIAAGLLGVVFFKTEPACSRCRTSNVGLGFIYTQNGQFLSGLLPEVFAEHDDWQLLGSARYVRYPGRVFGVGNETSADSEESFTSHYLKFRGEVRRRLVGDVFLGVRYDFDRTHLYDLEPAGVVAAGGVQGSTGGYSSGLGPTLTVDSRDHVLYPTRGVYHQISAVHYAEGFGSEYAFARYTADLRRYIPLGDRRVLALNAIVQLGAGQAPFYLLSLLGGSGQMRGTFEGRYRDNNLAVAQIEYRTPIVWRFGAAVFASVGQVARRVSDFDFGFHVAGGAGLRFLLAEKQGLNLRADVGVSDSGWAPYVLVKEAF